MEKMCSSSSFLESVSWLGGRYIASFFCLILVESVLSSLSLYCQKCGYACCIGFCSPWLLIDITNTSL